MPGLIFWALFLLGYLLLVCRNAIADFLSRVSLRQVHTGEHVGYRRNRDSWTGSLQSFILSQEVELILSPLCTFPDRGELAYRECSDPGTQEVDLRSRLLDTFPARGELACRECYHH